MFKYIVVPATGAETDAPVWTTALDLARGCAGHIKFLHVHPDVQAIMAAVAASDMDGGAGYDQVIGTLETDVAGRQKAAETAFHEFCERERITISGAVSSRTPSAEWAVETGDEATCLAEHGRTADLIVVGRGRGGDASDLLETLLMQTGRPVFIVPELVPDRISGTVVVAWKNRQEAARAVSAAQPLLEKAERVIILSVNEDAYTDERSCERLRQALLWHNPSTTVQRLKQDGGSDGDILMAASVAAEADVLVMGGYGHSRLREMIFGGITRRVLSGAGVPVFMMH
jgi:nucleotide-binding universal stress UspA family protein